MPGDLFLFFFVVLLLSRCRCRGLMSTPNRLSG